MPSVEAHVTTRPPVDLRYGRAARTTAAVPIRLTAMTCSHSLAGTCSSVPQQSMPAAVKTPVMRPPTRSASDSTALATALVSARSAATYGTSEAAEAGGVFSITSGTPPRRSTAATVAAPRPDEPPVMRTPSSGCAVISRPFGECAGGSRRGDQAGRGVTGHRGQDDHRAAVALHGFGFGELAGLVVPALHPDVGPQGFQEAVGGGPVEDRHGVDARERGQDPGAVDVAHHRSSGALERPHRLVRVDQDYQGVAELAGLSKQPDMSGVQE